MLTYALSSSYLWFETLNARSSIKNSFIIVSKYHIWIPMIFTCYFYQEIIKSLELVCLRNPNSSGYLVWLLQQVSSIIDQVFQVILHISSSYAYVILHESQKSRECQASKMVHGGWSEKIYWSKLGFPRPYLLQFLSYENDSKIKVTQNDIPNNFHV